MTTTAHAEGPDPRRFQQLRDYGFNVFPVLPRDKKPATAWQPYQARRATREEGERWASDRRGLNVGVVCGPTSANRVVLDVDSPEGRAELERRYGPLPVTPTVRTARGLHLYLIDSTGQLRNFAGKVPGVDLRGLGGYVVGPGSIHPDGTVYCWVLGRSPKDVDFEPVPDWLMNLDHERSNERKGELEPIRSILPRAIGQWIHPRVARYAEKALEHSAFRVANAVPGTRNDTLNGEGFSMGKLVGGGALDADQVVQALMRASDQNGLIDEDGERIVFATIRSGLSAGAQHPIDLSHLKGLRRWRHE